MINSPISTTLNKSIKISIEDKTITAYGYLISPGTSDIPTYLYGKTGEELGIASDPQRGINKLTYIQLDVSEIQDRKTKITIDNIKKEGGFALYGSNIKGQIGDLLYRSPDNPTTQTVVIPNENNYQYISITADGSSIVSNVMLRSIELLSDAP